MIYTKQSRCVLGLYFVFLVGFLQPVTSRVCTTSNCNIVGRHLHDNLRTSVNPCDDFYEYACGGWVQKHPYNPDDYQPYSRSKEYQKTLESQLCELLDERITRADIKAVRAAKIQYQACIDDEKLKDQGLQPLLNIIKENGGWPMIENSKFVPRKIWPKVHDYYLRKTGEGSIIKVLVEVIGNSSRIMVSHGELLFKLPVDPKDETQVDRRIQFIIQVATKFANANGVNVDNKRMKEDAESIYLLDKAFTNLKNTGTWDVPGPLISIDSANGLVTYGLQSKFNLFYTLRRVFDHVPGAHRFGNLALIRVRERTYLQEALEVLARFTDRDILNYIHFHFVLRQIYLTTPDMRQLYEQYHDMPPRNRSVECMQADNLKRVLSYMYLKRYFTEADQKAAEGLVNDIKASIERQIRQSDMIDDESMPVALGKLKNLDQSVGYRSWFANSTDVQETYFEYNMRDNYMLNMLNYREVEYKNYLSQFGSHESEYIARHKRTSVSPIDLTSAYHVRYNRLDIPATNLQLPFFGSDLPDLGNYAGAGALVANELANMYNDIGLHFDDRGNIFEWLSEKASDKYDVRYGCYGKQLVNYTLDALRKAGITDQTVHPSALPQTFMDSFALKTAYDAYATKIKTTGQPSKLFPVLDEYSPKKQFFLAFANPYCESTVGSSLADFAENGSNTPSSMRVNIAVSNLPEFSNIFQCPVDSPMNPVTKCRFFS